MSESLLRRFVQTPENVPPRSTELTPSPAPPVGKVRSRWNRKRIGLGLLAVLFLAGTTFWWQFRRLDPLEQQLVGIWSGSYQIGQHKLYLKLRADRSGEVIFSLPPMGPKLTRHEIRLKEPTWRTSHDRLILSETLSPWIRIKLIWIDLRSLATGGTWSNRQSMNLGEIRDVRPDSFELGEWHLERVP